MGLSSRRAAPCSGSDRQLTACGGLQCSSRGGAAVRLPAAGMVASGTWRANSMSGEGGGRAPQIYGWGRWICWWVPVLGIYLVGTKFRGSVWSTVATPRCEFGGDLWWLAPSASLILLCADLSRGLSGAEVRQCAKSYETFMSSLYIHKMVL
jgi:hypothetical protein